MIKSAKRAIMTILKDVDVNDEEMMTTFTGAKALINSRPLTYQSANVKDNIPLTPNHFLHGQMGGQFAPEVINEVGFNPKKVMAASIRIGMTLLAMMAARAASQFKPKTEMVQDEKC